MKRARRIRLKRSRPLSLGLVSRVGEVYEKPKFIIVSLSRVLVEEIEDYFKDKDKCPECGGICRD